MYTYLSAIHIDQLNKRILENSTSTVRLGIKNINITASFIVFSSWVFQRLSVSRFLKPGGFLIFQHSYVCLELLVLKGFGSSIYHCQPGAHSKVCFISIFDASWALLFSRSVFSALFFAAFSALSLANALFWSIFFFLASGISFSKYSFPTSVLVCSDRRVRELGAILGSQSNSSKGSDWSIWGLSTTSEPLLQSELLPILSESMDMAHGAMLSEKN